MKTYKHKLLITVEVKTDNIKSVNYCVSRIASLISSSLNFCGGGLVAPNITAFYDVKCTSAKRYPQISHAKSHKIGKLENGKLDPCYTCKHSDTPKCEYCIDYNKAEPRQKEANR